MDRIAIGAAIWLSALLSGCALTGQPSTPTAVALNPATQADTAAIERLIADYIALLNARDTAAISMRIYWAPMLIVSPDGQATFEVTPEGFAQNWSRFLDRLQATTGATVFSARVESVCFLTPSVAIVSYSSRRSKPSGEVASEASWAYPVTKRNNEWRIAASMPRSPGTTISCSNR